MAAHGLLANPEPSRFHGDDGPGRELRTASSISRYQERLDSFTAHEAPGVDQAGENVLALQPWVTLEQGFVIITSRQHPQDVLDR